MERPVEFLISLKVLVWFAMLILIQLILYVSNTLHAY